MLDALKNLGNSGQKPARQQAEDLQALIASSREERVALSTMLTQIQLQSAKLATAGKSLQEVDEKAAKAHARLDEVTERLAKADSRSKELETIDARIHTLIEAVSQAEQETVKLTAPDGIRCSDRPISAVMSVVFPLTVSAICIVAGCPRPPSTNNATVRSSIHAWYPTGLTSGRINDVAGLLRLTLQSRCVPSGSTRTTEMCSPSAITVGEYSASGVLVIRQIVRAGMS